MITKFGGINLSSKNPKETAAFYRKLGVRVLTENPDADGYDGVELGFDINAPHVWIWDEAKWGKIGSATLVFYAADLEKFHADLSALGIESEFKIAVWGGKEVMVKDPDGTTILVLE